MAVIEASLGSLRGVGDRVAQRLKDAGIHSPADLVTLLPRRYEDRRVVVPLGEATFGVPVVVRARVVRVTARRFGRRTRAEVIFEAGGLRLHALFFHFLGDPRERFTLGGEYFVTGTIGRTESERTMVHPDVEPADGEAPRAGRIVPVYPLVPGLFPRQLERLVHQARARVGLPADELPVAVRVRRGLVDLGEALAQAHEPPADLDTATLDAWNRGEHPLQRRLAYGELLLYEIGIAERRARLARTAPALPLLEESTRRGLFGFQPTAAQHRVMAEVAADLATTTPMRRLLQGDVGSGKTAVALAAIAQAVRAGVQVALMAPTEVLAEQLLGALTPSLERIGSRAVLLTGSLGAPEARRVRREVASGEAQLVVGTHALVEERVEFARLGLVVIDEQHRFGVWQRLRLTTKASETGAESHLLVMTATPIPRSLALALWGELDLAVLDEQPPGRRLAETRVVLPPARKGAYDLLAREVAQGGQAFVVAPRIRATKDGADGALSAESLYDEIRARLVGVKVSLLHGALPPETRRAALGDFASGRSPVLVATTVVEVGVDIPRANVVLIEQAERFGLAQLHQIRGRVGRAGGSGTPHCLLLAGRSEPAALERLRILEQTSDGFRIAEEDLRLRGPGQIYGRRQSGAAGFRFADIVRDVEDLASARQDARAIVQDDPGLDAPEHRGLRRKLEALRSLPIAEEAG